MVSKENLIGLAQIGRKHDAAKPVVEITLNLKEDLNDLSQSQSVQRRPAPVTEAVMERPGLKERNGRNVCRDL